MIAFSCPKCGKQFKVPDSAVGQHGWCKGCGTIIRVPQSSSASKDDIVDVKIDPQVEALLRHMAAQLKEQRSRAREAHEELQALRNESTTLAAQDQALQSARELTDALASQVAASAHERQTLLEAFTSALQSLQDAITSIPQRPEDQQIRPLQEKLGETQAELERERAAHATANERFQALETRCAALTQDSKARLEEVTRLQDKLERSEDKAADLAERCGKLDEQVAHLREERDEARRMLGDRQAADEQTETIAARLQEKESVIQRLTEEVRMALEGKGEADAISHQRLDDIEHLSAELSGVTHSSEAELAELKTELRAEREAHALVEFGLIQAQEDLRAARKEIDSQRSLEIDKASLERELVLLRESLEKERAEVDRERARLHETDFDLRHARERMESLEAEVEALREAQSSTADVAVEAAQDTDGQDKRIDRIPALTNGPFPGPFVPHSQQDVDAEGIALIPEVIDEDYDDQEMLDTLMRFLGPEN